MPQDTPKQAIVRGAIGRIRQQVPNVPGDFTDHSAKLSGVEWSTVLDVLQAFVAVPGEPGPNDPR